MQLPKYLGRALLLSATLLLAACGPGETPTALRLINIPAANGSMAPNLATGPGGQIVLSWIEPQGEDHALRYSVLDESGWQTPRTVATGGSWFVNWADFPSVVPLTDTLWAAHWLDSQPAGGYAYDVRVAMSTDGGANWSEPFLPHYDGTPTEHGFVTLYPDGANLGLVWLDGRKMISEYDENDKAASGMTLRGATFGTDKAPIRSGEIDDLTCDCCQTEVALTREGPVVVYRNRTTDELRDIYVSRRENGEWLPGVPIAEDNWEIPACPVNGPIVRADGDDVAVAWFTAANDSPMVKAAWSNDGARSFSNPVIVSDERPLGHVGAVLLPDGDLVISWHRGIGEGAAELYLRRVSPDGTMSEALRVDEAAGVFAISVPQLALSGEDLVLAWTTRKEQVYNIHSAIVPLQKFGN